MRTGLIARKLGMTSVFKDTGERIGVTFLKLDDCVVVDHKTHAKNGYNALVLGAKNTLLSKINKPTRHVFVNSKIEPKYLLKEFRISENSFIDIGSQLDANHFVVGQLVDVSGATIGKGFAGGMKRWNFAGLEASHGVSISHRSHGSTGGRQDPGRVFKNKKMAGHMGTNRVTIQNLKIVDIDVAENIIMVAGSIPGSKGSYVYIADAIK